MTTTESRQLPPAPPVSLWCRLVHNGALTCAIATGTLCAGGFVVGGLFGLAAAIAIGIVVDLAVAEGPRAWRRLG